MKKDQQPKVEIQIDGKRYTVSAAAAKIAIDTLGATEVLKYERPKELQTKTIKPPVIPTEAKPEAKPVDIIKPEYKPITVKEIKPRAQRVKK